MLGEAIRDPDKTGQAESGAGKAPTKKHILCNTEDHTLVLTVPGCRLGVVQICRSVERLYGLVGLVVPGDQEGVGKRQLCRR